jgi:hypothetical protein
MKGENPMIQVDETDPVVKKFSAESAKLSGLQRDYGAIGRRIEEKFEALAKIAQKSGQDQDVVTAAARAMLVGGDVLEVDRATLQKDLEDLEQRKQVIERAIQLQRGVVSRVRGPYSLRLNDQVQGRHEYLVLRTAQALRELAICFDQEASLFDELRTLDANVSLRPMRLSSIGSLRDDYSRPNMFLREIEEFFPQPFKELAVLTTKSRGGLTVFKCAE